MDARVQPTLALLREAAADYSPAVLASSLGPEDMVLLDLIDRNALPIGVFTLDTGRLPGETYDLLQLARQRYRTAIAVFLPDGEGVEALCRGARPQRILR